MTKLGKKNQKRLAKLVSMALMCAGGGLFSLPSVASASEVTVTNVTGDSPLYDVDPSEGMKYWGSIFDRTKWSPTSANVLNITGAFDANQIEFYGGYNAGASGKTVNIKGTDTDIGVSTVAGGYANGNYSVTGNHVNFLGGTTTVWEIYGGFGKNGADVSNNHVNIAKGSTVKYSGYGVMIFGGREDTGEGDVDANTVTISGTLATALPSANLFVTVAGGFRETGDGKSVTGNRVTISGATFNTGANDTVDICGGLHYGTNGNATDNHVTIIDGTVPGNVYGGSIHKDDYSGTGNATGNTVTISGGEVGVVGGFKAIYGGYVDSGAVDNNTVNISDGTINGNVFGGFGSGSASNNKINITGGTFDPSVSLYGGSGATTTEKNTIKISGGKTKDEDHLKIAHICVNDGAEGTGNKLVLGTSGIEVTSWGTMTNIIEIDSSVAFADGTTVLKSSGDEWTKGFEGLDTLDISGATGLFSATDKGTMTLLASSTDNNFSTLKLAYDTATKTSPKTLDATTPSVIVKSSGEGGTEILSNKVVLTTTGGTTHTVSLDKDHSYKNVLYTIVGDGNVTVTKVDLKTWNSTQAAASMDDYTLATGATIETDGMATIPDATTNILTTTTENYFSQDKITGENKYKESKTTEGANGVTLDVTQGKGVKANNGGKDLVYEIGTEKKVTGLTLDGTVPFNKDTKPYDGSGTTYNYTGSTSTGSLAVTFTDPLAATAKDSMVLLAANNTLGGISSEVKTVYENVEATGVAGMTLSGEILGKVAKNDSHEVTYTVDSNKASALTFGKMEWADGATLLDHSAALSNVSFAGAAVDTSNIQFTDKTELLDGKKTLVANYGGTPGPITGATYSVGVGITGVGQASMDGDNLIFTATSEAALDEEMAHNTLMGAEVSMAALSVGNEFIGAATDGLGLAANIGEDGVSTFARMGGGSMRQETGSHVDTHTWNAILALGHKNEKEKSSFEYGAFFEYGTGNYTTHNGDERGDGSMHYTGGGLLAKWQKKGGLYVEGGLRAGSVHDDARNVLREANGTPHSYETNAGYWGVHIGVGKEIALKNGDAVDVYGKYFYNRKNGVDFNANGAVYDLDAVTSSVIRVGARYTMKRERWNFYTGLAYEHEMDGKASGTVTAPGVNAAIRSADISGGSGRLEIGATMKPDKNSPWSLDLNVTGFAGKKQGVMGGVSVAWMF